MKNILILATALLIGSSAFAEEIKISSANYEEAQKAKNYFKFIGHSRKLGIIGTSFEGYARKAELSFDRKSTQLENVKLSLETAEIDTDNNSRNEKMWDTCLNRKEFPVVIVRLIQPIQLALPSQEIPGELIVRGVTLPLVIKMEKNDAGEFTGQSSFKLSEAKIPDPSILVASVKDEFELEFRVNPSSPTAP